MYQCIYRLAVGNAQKASGCCVGERVLHKAGSSCFTASVSWAGCHHITHSTCTREASRGLSRTKLYWAQKGGEPCKPLSVLTWIVPAPGALQLSSGRYGWRSTAPNSRASATVARLQSCCAEQAQHAKLYMSCGNTKELLPRA